MFSRLRASKSRSGDLSKIEYTWTRSTRDHAVLVAVCLKNNDEGKLVGTYSAYKEARNLHCAPADFAKDMNWYNDLEYEIAEQMDNDPFGHFDLETYISIHNTSIRTRA
jgi:hypothetical protein